MIQTVLKDLECEAKEISILFTDDSHIRDLNSKYLKKEKPTNVLAFPIKGDTELDIESGMLGDVVISIDTAVREAGERGEKLEITIYRLLIHGILHLLGFDHERSDEDERIMEKEEERLLILTAEEEHGSFGS